MNINKLYCTSIQFELDEWILHYAWYYYAESFLTALNQCMAHFHASQRGKLLSVNMTDGENVLVMRYDSTTMEQYVRIHHVGDSDIILSIGPNTMLTKETMI